MKIDDTSSTVLSYMYPQLVVAKASEFNQEVKVYKFLGKHFVSVQKLTQSGGLLQKIWDTAVYQVDSKYLTKPPKTALILGLGAGSAVSSLRKVWPEISITAVEIDPVMLEVGKTYFGLESDSKLNIVNQDAFLWLEHKNGGYDVLLVDLYVGRNIPQEANTKAFIKKIQQHLNPGGVGLFNRLVLKGELARVESFYAKLRSVFGQVVILKTPANKVFLVKS
jgi:spermidine synthase